MCPSAVPGSRHRGTAYRSEYTTWGRALTSSAGSRCQRPDDDAPVP
ncbi:MAG: hypothetical protein MI924_27205 [Chloroflexales bacterium]|nr:hypothetical protein [Chloroflexales bacterium]